MGRGLLSVARRGIEVRYVCLMEFHCINGGLAKSLNTVEFLRSLRLFVCLVMTVRVQSDLVFPHGVIRYDTSSSSAADAIEWSWTLHGSFTPSLE